MSEVTREQIIAAHPLIRHLEQQGIKLRGAGDQLKGNRCPAVQHRKDHWCVSVKVSEGIFRCNDCETGGSVIDWMAIESGRDAKSVYKELAEKLNGSNDPIKFGAGREARNSEGTLRTPKEGSNPSPNTKPKIVKTYDYTDERGRIVYQTVRLEPKDFRQRRPDGNDGWLWNMEGQTRYLYRLPEVLNATECFICEGEKDCDNLVSLGFVATCNVGGAGKWLSAYSDFLAEKDIIIIPDNDKPGRDHAEMVVESLGTKANSIKVVTLPTGKDASDFIATFQKPEDAAKALRDLISKMAHVLKPLPIYTIKEMEEASIRFYSPEAATYVFNLGRLFPSFGKIRSLIPGELVTIIGDTGQGKSCLLQSIARAAKPLPTLFFELELPIELMFERFVQMETNSTGEEVEQAYRSDLTPRWLNYRGNHHILVCNETGIGVERMEEYINRSELKFGMRPKVVEVDYIGLVSESSGRSRYEKVSDAAEKMKIMAVRTNTICFMGSQVARPDKKKKDIEVRLHDAKDSGSIEQSSQLVLGMWRPEPETLIIRVLKNTRGATGLTVECNFDGARMKITERSKIAE
jgi:5S rRNA maturation endonuclease (ribonuclease M5)/energy-coupling factor transporter ATP-binding protein EcfA2